MRHFTAGAPLQAGQPLTVVSGKSAKSTLYPAEGKHPAEDPDKKRRGKAYPKGQPFDRVAAQDFREGEVVVEEALISPAEHADRQQEQKRDQIQGELSRRTGRRQPPPTPPVERDPGVRVRG